MAKISSNLVTLPTVREEVRTHISNETQRNKKNKKEREIGTKLHKFLTLRNSDFYYLIHT